MVENICFFVGICFYRSVRRFRWYGRILFFGVGWGWCKKIVLLGGVSSTDVCENSSVPWCVVFHGNVFLGVGLGWVVLLFSLGVIFSEVFCFSEVAVV